MYVPKLSGNWQLWLIPVFLCPVTYQYLSWVGTDVKTRATREIHLRLRMRQAGLDWQPRKIRSSQLKPNEKRRGTRLRRGKRKSGSQERNCRVSQRREKSSKASNQMLLVKLDRSLSGRCKNLHNIKRLWYCKWESRLERSKREELLETSKRNLEKQNPSNWLWVISGQPVWTILAWSPPSSSGIVEIF
jgi:hypothetical protein